MESQESHSHNDRRLSIVEIFFLNQYLWIAGVAQSQGSQRYIIDPAIVATVRFLRLWKLLDKIIFYLLKYFSQSIFRNHRSRTVARSIMYHCDPCDCAIPATPKILIEKIFHFHSSQSLQNIFLSNNFQSSSNRTVATIAGSKTPKILIEKKYFISICCDHCDCAIPALRLQKFL